MQLFPGRTLGELDDMDEGRLYRALEARSIGRECHLIEGWTDGTTSAERFQAIDPDLVKEYMAWQRNKNG